MPPQSANRPVSAKSKLKGACASLKLIVVQNAENAAKTTAPKRQERRRSLSLPNKCKSDEISER